MEPWYQRCAVAACGHITATEVCNGGDLSQFSDDIGVTNLQGERALLVARWPMADSLPMGADAANAFWIAVQIRKKCIDGLCGYVAKISITSTHQVNVVNSC